VEAFAGVAFAGAAAVFAGAAFGVVFAAVFGAAAGAVVLAGAVAAGAAFVGAVAAGVVAALPLSSVFVCANDASEVDTAKANSRPSNRFMKILPVIWNKLENRPDYRHSDPELQVSSSPRTRNLIYAAISLKDTLPWGG
jgi:hypothetical protein